MGEVPVVDATAVHDEETGTVTVFAVNRDQHEPLALALDLRSLPNLAVGEHTALFDDDPEATNTADRPDRVTPTRLADVKATGGTATVVLPALSWNMLSFSPDR
jgi:alpha-N-arabinofuranosidase